ncbi:cupin domain-containing protein [Pseudomonas sp. NPDC089534]|uniref:cupin domain-containing protein n=1 Tax=Pseudomonas sp. NPDC089534 TaxID=3364468 RepID=UPI0038105A22
MKRYDALELAAALNLEPHAEGGFYRRTYQNDLEPMIDTPDGKRHLMSSIYYLLTEDAPIGHLHLNRSDIVHYYHVGDAIEYSLILPDGTLKTVVMGADVLAGQHLQLYVPGGVWKASRLLGGEHGFGLISEAVSPGFDYADMKLGERDELTERFPQHRALIDRLAL